MITNDDGDDVVDVNDYDALYSGTFFAVCHRRRRRRRMGACQKRRKEECSFVRVFVCVRCMLPEKVVAHIVRTETQTQTHTNDGFCVWGVVVLCVCVCFVEQAYRFRTRQLKPVQPVVPQSEYHCQNNVNDCVAHEQR